MVKQYDKKFTIRLPEEFISELEKEAQLTNQDVTNIFRQYALRGRIRDLGKAEIEQLFERAFETIEALKTKINTALTFNAEADFTKKQRRSLWKLIRKQNQNTFSEMNDQLLVIVNSLDSIQNWMQSSDERQDKFAAAINQLAAGLKNLHLWLEGKSIK